MHDEQQTTRHVLMVRPHCFGPNVETAASNAFQRAADRPPAEIREQALREFDAMVETLSGAGISPIVFEDTDDPEKPDAVFPNNWVSFHADGRVFLYPLEAADRRPERRLDIVEALSSDRGFRVREIVDLSALESSGQFLEGTGSMVLDRVNRVAYAALSSRTHMDALADFAQLADYEITAFDAGDKRGQPIYHTNVMLAVGTRFAVVCADAIVNDEKRSAVRERLAASGHDVVDIGIEQLSFFIGNLLELVDDSGNPVIALSRTARDALTDEQAERIANCGRLLPVDIGTIERFGGGSVRCMLAEIFLPRTAAEGHA